MITLFRRIAIGVVFVLVIITGGLWIVSGKAYTPPVKEKYAVKIYHKNPEKFDEIVAMLTQEGKTPTVNKQIKKTMERPVAFVLFQKFHEDEKPEWHAQNLKKKKIDATLTKNPDGKTSVIELKKVFAQKKQADAMVVKIQEITAIKFDIKEKMKEFTFTTNELIIGNLDSREEAEEIKETAASKVVNPDSDIIIDVVTSDSEGTGKEPDASGTDSDKPGMKDGDKGAEKN